MLTRVSPMTDPSVSSLPPLLPDEEACFFPSKVIFISYGTNAKIMKNTLPELLSQCRGIYCIITADSPKEG